MKQKLSSLRVVLLGLLGDDEVTPQEIVEVFRETIKSEMERSLERTKRSRSILEQLRIPYHYTTTPDYLKHPTTTVGAAGTDQITFQNK